MCQAGENGDLLDPQTSTVDEMLRNLSEDQKEAFIFAIQSVLRGGTESVHKHLADQLAQDENLLNQFQDILEFVERRLTQRYG